MYTVHGADAAQARADSGVRTVLVNVVVRQYNSSCSETIYERLLYLHLVNLR